MYKAVLYTDGSSPINPGICGYGIFGYIYDTEQDPGKGFTRDGVTTTDKGFTDHTKGGEIVTPLLFVEAYGNFKPEEVDKELQTNNFGEVAGVYNALKIALKQGIKDILIYTDSVYAISSLENIEQIHSNDYKKSDGSIYKSEPILRSLYTIKESVKQIGGNIVIKWVKGHKGFYGNEQADMLASVSTKRAKNLDYITHLSIKDLKEFKQVDKSDKPDLLCFPRLYFSSNANENKHGEYFMAGYITTKPDQFYLGKKSSDSIYGLLKLNKSCKQVEDIINTHQSMNNRYNKLVRIDLNMLFKKNTIRQYNGVGNYCMVPKCTRSGLHTVSNLEGNVLSIDEIPSCLAFKAIEVSRELSAILGPFMRGEKLPANVVMYDITSALYDAGGKINCLKLKPEYVNSNVKIPLKCSGLDIDIEFRYNLPDRNTMKRLENSGVRVMYGRSLVENQILFDFTIINCMDGSLIMTNRYAKRITDNIESHIL